MTVLSLRTAILAAPLFLAGCTTDYVTFFTTDNVGLNVQSNPTPKATIAVGRSEGVIEPSFENGNTPAVAATVQHKPGGFFSSMTGDIHATFAGGNAAVNLAGGARPGDRDPGVACVPPVTPPTTKPSDVTVSKRTQNPFFFATNTSIGFGVEFSETPSNLAPNVHLGYRRNEMAIAKIDTQLQGCAGPGETNESKTWTSLAVPSFVATERLETAAGNRPSDGATPTGGKFLHAQLFATGKAAELVTSDVGVSGSLRTLASGQMAAANMVPGAVSKQRLQDWLGTDNANKELLTAWIKANLAWIDPDLAKAKSDLSQDDFISKSIYEPARQRALTALVYS